MKQINESSVIICSIVRDAEKGLKRNIPVIDELCKRFRDFRIIVYENDSKDGTKALLEEWCKKDERIHVSLNMTDSTKTIPLRESTGGVNPFFSHKRIDKMARIRNNYMEYVDTKGWTADYMIVVDLDVAQLYMNTILTSFEADKDWDAVCAFGYSTSPKLMKRYHDTYALTEWGDQENPQTEEKITVLADKYGTLKPSDEWVRIASGFGGLAIYRFEVVRGLRYEALDNDDAGVEVKCEHFSLYKQMTERGYDRFYINPAMTLKYQDLTWEIVHGSLMRKAEVAVLEKKERSKILGKKYISITLDEKDMDTATLNKIMRGFGSAWSHDRYLFVTHANEKQTADVVKHLIIFAAEKQGVADWILFEMPKERNPVCIIDSKMTELEIKDNIEKACNNHYHINDSKRYRRSFKEKLYDFMMENIIYRLLTWGKRQGIDG